MSLLKNLGALPLITTLTALGCGPGILEDNAPDTSTPLPDDAGSKDVFLRDAIIEERPVIGNPPSVRVTIAGVTSGIIHPIYRGSTVNFHLEPIDSDGKITALTYRIGASGRQQAISLPVERWTSLTIPCDLNPGEHDIYFTATDNHGNEGTTPFPITVQNFNSLPSTTPIHRDQALCENISAALTTEEDGIRVSGVAARKDNGNPQAYFTLTGGIFSRGHRNTTIQDIIIRGGISLSGNADGSPALGATIRNVEIRTEELTGLSAVGIDGLNIDTLTIEGSLTPEGTTYAHPETPLSAQGLLTVHNSFVIGMNSVYLSRTTGPALSWTQGGGPNLTSPAHLENIGIQNVGTGYYFVGAPLNPLNILQTYFEFVSDCAFRAVNYDTGSNPVLARLGMDVRFGDNVNQQFCDVPDPDIAFPRE